MRQRPGGADSLLAQQRKVATVAIDDEDVIIKLTVEGLTSLHALLDDLHLHVFRHLADGADCGGSTTHHHHVLHIHVVFLAHHAADIGGM